MTKVTLIVAITLLVALGASASTTPEVIELTDENFIKTVAEAPDAVWLVEFFAPWCGHCKKLTPVWDQLARVLHAREDADIRVAKIDCTENKEMASAFGINGFPTIKLIKGDQFYDVNVARTVEAFTEYVEKGSWPKGSPYPPKIQTTSPPEPTKVASLIPDSLFELDPWKIWSGIKTVLYIHQWASGVIILIGALFGLLATLICCFPNPRVVHLQSADRTTSTPSEAKEAKVKED